MKNDFRRNFENKWLDMKYITLCKYIRAEEPLSREYINSILLSQ